ncbi:MAG TPA: universal stress protein [Devosiaceae bacterium]|nr:universal stress protein [Devosiaceae bacterium]
MYSTILIATDGSELSNKGLEQGLALAKALGARVTLLNASEPFAPMGVDATGFTITDYALVEEREKSVADAGAAVLREAEREAAVAGVPAKGVYVANKLPADAILDYATQNDIDLIVMASHGRRGIERVLLGSQTNEVLTRSTVPVLVIR